MEVSFTEELKRSPSAEQAAQAYAQTDTRPIAKALVKCTPASVGGESWHRGGTDPNSPEHITVEYKDAKNGHITTKHINREGKAV